jgi:hypothetical protein
MPPMIKEYVAMLGVLVGVVLLGYASVNYFHLFSPASVANPSNKNRLGDFELMEVIRKIEAEQPPRITGNETVEEIYNNPYIKHIRTALNGYLDGSNTGAEEVVAVTEAHSSDRCGLYVVDKSYYESKFFLYDATDNEYGGVQAYIVFVDKPDTLFWTWVYRLGGNGEYSLRGFCKSGPSEEKKERFLQVMKNYIESGEMKFSL